jgi:DNA-binding FrmR family transcriptional regulator
MSHTTREKKKLLNRVRRIRGQVEAIERTLEGENDCVQVLQLIASTRGAINGLMAEVLEDHVREHVAAPNGISDVERAKGADELIDLIRTYFK